MPELSWPWEDAKIQRLKEGPRIFVPRRTRSVLVYLLAQGWRRGYFFLVYPPGWQVEHITRPWPTPHVERRRRQVSRIWVNLHPRRWRLTRMIETYHLVHLQRHHRLVEVPEPPAMTWTWERARLPRPRGKG